MENDRWVIIPGTNCEISISGLVRNIQSKKEYKSYKNSNGYLYVTILFEQGRKSRPIHRLLAGVFIPNPDNKPYVNHRDGGKLNNELQNLEWCTASENSIHAYAQNLMQDKLFITQEALSKRRVPVYQYSKDLLLLASFKSISEAVILTGIKKTKLTNHIKSGKPCESFIYTINKL